MKKLDKLVIGFTVLWMAIPFMVGPMGYGTGEGIYYDIGSQLFWILLLDIPYVIYRIKQTRKQKQQKKFITR